MMMRNKPQEKGNIRTALPRLTQYLKSSLGVMIVALVLAALSAVMTIIGPNKIGDMATLMSDGLMTGIDLSAVAQIGIFMAVIYVLSALFGFAQHYIMTTVTLKMSYRMRGELSEKINKVPQKYFNTTSQGDILSRITNDVSTLQQALTNSLPTIVSAATQFVGCLIMMFVTEWRLALISLAVTLLGLVLVVVIMSKSQRYFAERQRSLGEINGYVEEMYSGHQVVRISRAVRKVTERFDRLNDEVYDANWRSQFLSGVMQPLMSVIGNIAYVAVCVVGSILAMNGSIQFGVIVSFILYVRLFTSPLTQIAQGMTNMQTASASAHRIFDFLQSEEMPDESGKPVALSQVRGQVTFDHVRFSYPDTPDKVIIKDFSARVQPGQKVAIVGPTGAGKTTMVNLLMRFFEVNSGSISIDGTPLTDMSRQEVHSLFSMVLQDTWLFEATVRENLVYNMQGITDDQLEKVCRACGLDKFIHSLPKGFDTVLSDSTSISAGQKQLLTIARAMLQNAPMLILDEATSSVDTRTELLIQRAMDELTKDRTSFVIAHRLSTIKNADLILVMRDGDVVESGTHDQLMEKGGFYAD
ncbi:MAG: ABC transporter ATP-binding protein, partial [Candidatus Limiplasma sp.]|nr:ABC transporter ATP-binding protein [Candidatus Limiplasma sp.]